MSWFRSKPSEPEPQLQCPVCFDDLPLSQLFTWDCKSAHRFCHNCLHHQATTCHEAGRVLCCPGESCGAEVSPCDLDILLRLKIITQPMHARINRIWLIRAVESMGGKCCPTPGCQTVVVPNDPAIPELCPCAVCKLEFCSLCQKTYHYSSSCAEFVSCASVNNIHNASAYLNSQIHCGGEIVGGMGESRACQVLLHEAAAEGGGDQGSG